MAKKRRSAAQKRATRKLVAGNKRRAKPRSKARKRSKSRSKANKPKRRSKRMVSKRKAPSRKGSRALIDKIPLLKNKTVQRIGFGLGMGSIAAIAANAVPVPIIRSNAQLIGTGVAFATDPLSGVVRLALSGGLQQITGLFGGGNNGAIGGGSGTSGFA